MKNARPYDSEGSLDSGWRSIVETMDGNKEAVTAKKLLEYYEAILDEDQTLVEDPTDPCGVPKIEEVDTGHSEKAEDWDDGSETFVDLGSPWTVQPFRLHKRVPIKSETMPEQTPPDLSLTHSTFVPAKTPYSRETKSSAQIEIKRNCAMDNLTESDVNINSSISQSIPATLTVSTIELVAWVKTILSPKSTPSSYIELTNVAVFSYCYMIELLFESLAPLVAKSIGMLLRLATYF
jgi:hypothetical protein